MKKELLQTKALGHPSVSYNSTIAVELNEVKLVIYWPIVIKIYIEFLSIFLLLRYLSIEAFC